MKKNYLIILMCSLPVLNIYAQSNSSDIKSIESLLDLSANINRKNQDSAIIYANEALKLAEIINDNNFIAMSHEHLGQAYRFGNQQEKARKSYAEAIKFYGTNEKKIAKLQHWTGHTYAAESEFKKAIEQYQITNEYARTNQDTSLLANCALDIGVIHARKGSFYVAIEYFFNSIEYYDAMKETVHIVPLLNNIGSIYLDTKDYEKGLIYLKKARERLELTPEQKDDYIVHIATNIGICYTNLNQFDKAVSYYELALSEAERLNDSFIKATVYNQLGALFIEKNEIKQAQGYYEKAYDLTKKENYQAEYAAALKGLSMVSKEKGRYTEALKLIEKSNAINIKLDNLDNIVTDYELLASIHEELGNSAKAYSYLKNYIALKDSVFNIDKEAEISLMESKYNYKQEELKLTTEVQNLKRDKNLQQSRQTILVLILFLISLIVSVLFWFLSKKREENLLLKKDLENKEIIEQQSIELKSLNEILEEKVEERTNELQAANENLEQANYELRTFNYIASHDIKEPIRVISGYASLIYKQLTPELRENLNDYFKTIKRSTKQLYTLVEDFARYTTLSKGESVDKQIIDLNYLIDSIIENLQESIRKYNGQVIVSDLPEIKSNSSLLMSILKNLIENGLKYNQSENPKVNISFEQTATNYHIIIADNGIGIEENYHEKIFEMFKRLNNRAEYEGSGIGLAIVKLCTTKLGGTIDIISELDKGTTFIIKLPIT